MNARVLGLVGAAVLSLGVFAPIVRIPIAGSVNYFRNGEGDGVILLALGAISFLLIFTRRIKWLFATGVTAAAVLLATYWNITSRLEKVREDLNTDLADNPFRGLADAAAAGMQLEWGWAVLVSGSILLIVAALMRAPMTNPTKKCRFCAEQIQVDAILCKHCGREVVSEPQVEGAPILVRASLVAEPLLPGRVLGVSIVLAVVVFAIASSFREYVQIAAELAGL